MVNEDESRKDRDASLDKRVEDFTEEIKVIGEKLGDRIEREVERIDKKAERIGRRYLDWYDRTFGVTGPIFISIICLVALLLIIQIIGMIHNPIFSDLSNFLSHYILWLFIFILFFSFSSYLSRRYSRRARWVSPVLSAIGLFIVLWLLIKILNIIENRLNVSFLSVIISVLDSILILLVVLVLIVGYLVLLYSYIIRRYTKCSSSGDREERANDYKDELVSDDEEYKRLYRSGRERVLGGVCGGIGEYLRIDPVTVRLIWFVGVFLTVGVLFFVYFVFWIIIPRNPKHEWNDYFQ
ncbi:MAG: PspC domain-containing protein [Candidatus Thermoplasmatota archaeon]